MDNVLKWLSLLSLLLVNLLYLYHFIAIAVSSRFFVFTKVAFRVHLVISSALVFYIFQFHSSSFLIKASDFLLLIAWGIALVFGVIEWKFSKKSLGALVLPIPLILSFVSMDSLNFSEQTPKEYSGYLFLLHVSFYLAGYICAFYTLLVSFVYSISLNLLKQKKINSLTRKMPPLALQRNQFNIFLFLTVIFLSFGLFFGFLWIYQLQILSKEMIIKIVVSSVGAFFFWLLLLIRNRYNISFRSNICLVSLGCLFLIISLVIGKHGA